MSLTCVQNCAQHYFNTIIRYFTNDYTLKFRSLYAMWVINRADTAWLADVWMGLGASGDWYKPT